MIFTDAESRFLTRQERGHLSTIGAAGWPQVKPLGFAYNAALETIDITGYAMASSAKYRNVQAVPRVAFVVDEVTEPTAQGAHFLEIRGIAETVTHVSTDPHLDPEIIRIRPLRVIAYNVGPDQPGLYARNVTDQTAGA
ncbi:PPOX class F420-dependent oxidoreductase [Frankia sp. R82]|uniref:PPOX class F420-dependent oxidoreductase n=1 Tax=Frankia sp. R82 TaxID=2950553 RepID=UPI0020446B14|nr:PPOX class F420-dependent oxidoreductase [Frankia sp. R82]MCM3885537.1 PPOX class F420-dependent oxidoreductase [Frankia sp. R82]